MVELLFLRSSEWPSEFQGGTDAIVGNRYSSIRFQVSAQHYNRVIQYLIIIIIAIGT